ncbi:DUF1767 domain-containing protein [Favolaschia claudopus]|uniref:RecQ-mediated genome instability protein 1 n=1 Tax=Favolaschia claudopus TaxID=2862362 RepID=A0AAW0C4A5_9AGAR
MSLQAPDQVIDWLTQHYPSPRVDREWLDACYDWVVKEQNLDPATNMPRIIEQVESQLLQSDLCDSMSHGTGIPHALLTATVGTLRGPVLVEIVSLTEVGSSALALDQVRVAREERIAAGAGLGDEENEADLDVDGEGPVPDYPRSVLRFELNDGASTIPAFEYRPLPDLKLGATPLGYKMILKNVRVRRGMAFLEPACVTLKGHQTEDRDAQREADFAASLRRRLGRPEPEPAPQPAAQAAQNAAQEQNPAPPPEAMRSPLREISPPPSPTLPVDSHHHSDDEDQPRRRRVPAPPPSTSPSSTLVTTSSYFSSGGSADPPPRRGNMGLVLSPTRSGPIEIESSSDEENRISRRPMVGLRKTSQKKATRPAPPPPRNDEPASDDYGDMMDMDDSFLEALQKAEDSQNTVPAGPSNAHASGSESQRPVVSDAVITIDDDDEMEDKENVPAPQRHVRRRVFGETRSLGEVIDISSD